MELTRDRDSQPPSQNRLWLPKLHHGSGPLLTLPIAAALAGDAAASFLERPIFSYKPRMSFR